MSHISVIYCCDNGSPGHVKRSLGENPWTYSSSLPSPVDHVVVLVPGVSWAGIREAIMCSLKPFSCAWHYFLHQFWNNLEIHLCEDKNEPVLESKSLSHGHCILTLEDVSCCFRCGQYNAATGTVKGHKWCGCPVLLHRGILQKRIFNFIFWYVTHSLCAINGVGRGEVITCSVPVKLLLWSDWLDSCIS